MQQQIFDALIDAGSEGTTASAIAAKLGVNRVTVADKLKKIVADGQAEKVKYGVYVARVSPEMAERAGKMLGQRYMAYRFAIDRKFGTAWTEDKIVRVGDQIQGYSAMEALQHPERGDQCAVIILNGKVIGIVDARPICEDFVQNLFGKFQSPSYFGDGLGTFDLAEKLVGLYVQTAPSRAMPFSPHRKYDQTKLFATRAYAEKIRKHALEECEIELEGLLLKAIQA